MKDLQEKIVLYAPYIESATNLGLSENTKDLYFLMDSLVEEVRSTYPQAPCKDKCSMCCESYGLPRTTAIEWQLIHNYIVNEMSEEIKQKVIDQVLTLHLPQVSELMKEQARIQEPHTQRVKANSPRPDFKCGYCPFLVDKSCSIYPARPAICRAYGFFSIRVEGKSEIFTCQMAAEKIINLLKDKGVENWVLPVWDKFAEKIYELNKNKPISTLPVWVITHLDENNKIKSEINLDPEFPKI